VGTARAETLAKEQRLHADTEHRNGQRDVADAARRADPFHAASRRSVAALTNVRDGSQSIEWSQAWCRRKTSEENSTSWERP